VLLALAGGRLMISGVVPVKASSGHFRVTRWLLQFAKERSVATQTLGKSSQKLDEPWLVLKGAGHYQSACRPCHGAPDLRPPLVPAQMTPSPPSLAPRIASWEPEELFYIVKHGIKFTGMPAWPSLVRDDSSASYRPVSMALWMAGVITSGSRGITTPEIVIDASNGYSRAVESTMG
jgi:hypothetical protein